MPEPADHLDILKHGTQAEMFSHVGEGDKYVPAIVVDNLQAGVPETWQMETLRAQLAKMQKQIDDDRARTQEFINASVEFGETVGESLVQLDQKIKDLQVLTLDIKP